MENVTPQLEKPEGNAEEAPTFSTTLSRPGALRAVEELADRMLADITFSQPDAYGAQAEAGQDEEDGVSILRRCSVRPEIRKSQPGLAFAHEANNVRKFYIANHEGECRVDFYNSISEYDRGEAPFSSYNVAAGYEGILLYRNSDPIPVYARVTTLIPPHYVYIHMEWYC
jgi:hypothetical protein